MYMRVNVYTNGSRIFRIHKCNRLLLASTWTRFSKAQMFLKQHVLHDLILNSITDEFIG